MPDADAHLQRALQIAHRYLNQRERTRAEVRRRLTSSGIDGIVVEEAIANLTEHGLLDDARFARLLTEDKRELEGWGNERLRRTLLERGIDDDVVAQALRNDDATELERGLALLRRRFPTPPQNRRERDRALGVMLRKGYDAELALEALATFAANADDEALR